MTSTETPTPRVNHIAEEMAKVERELTAAQAELGRYQRGEIYSGRTGIEIGQLKAELAATKAKLADALKVTTKGENDVK